MQNKRIIFFADQDPSNPNSGGMIRDQMWLQLLDQTRGLKTLWLNTHPLENKSIFKKILSLFRSYPENGWQPSVEDELKKLYSEGSILLISRLTNGKYISVAKKIGYQVILDEHNVESHLIRQLLPSFFMAPYQWYLYLRLKNIEKKYCNQADQITCTSELEKELLAHWIPTAKVHVVPNLIKTENYPATKSFSERSHLLFAGTLDYYPNITGLKWFIHSVYPGIKKKNPFLLAKLLIAGRNPTPELKKLINQHGIRLIENPLELKSILSESILMFVPLLHGGGTRIKILESMASGAPVVSTGKGTEGLDFEGKGVWTANDAESFADKMVELATHQQQFADISKTSQKSVSEYCNIPAYRLKVKSLLDSMI